MQLTYRGIQYNSAPASTPTVDSGLTASYRGVTYPILKSNAVATVSTKTLKYRGITIGASETGYFPAPGTAMA